MWEIVGFSATTTDGQRVRAEEDGRVAGAVVGSVLAEWTVFLLFQMLQLKVDSAVMCRLLRPVKRETETDQILAGRSRSGEFEALVKKAAPD